MKDLGILVLGHRREKSLSNVLESLKRQSMLMNTHVWLDGCSHSDSVREKVDACRALRGVFDDAHWCIYNGRVGIEKLMLDALSFMANQYHKIIVLEDDCFPTHNAIEVFSNALDSIDANPAVYSVYGHHFLVEGEADGFSRFQGWGWATTRNKLVSVLSQLKAMFLMPEPDYLEWVSGVLSPELMEKLDRTPGRDVLKVLERHFSWDSATALLTAILGLTHRPTPERVVYNCGIGEGSGHFLQDVDRFRAPPFNMIGPDEVWQYFYRPLPALYAATQYFGLNELDRKIAEQVGVEKGCFVEVGAFDGINQSNTLYLERSGWRGLLIEPIPTSYQQCLMNRPLAQVVNAACVGKNFSSSHVDMVSVGLMSLIKGARSDERSEQEWVARGESLQQIERQDCVVPAKTLASVLAEQGITDIDLLSIDVEGYEAEVLDGMDFEKYRPRFVVLEDSGTTDLIDLMAKNGYEVSAVLSERNFTRDLLFVPKV